MTSIVTKNKRRLSDRQLVMNLILVSEALTLISKGGGGGGGRTIEQLLIVRETFCFMMC
jgi:hypothetical protein